MPEISMKEVVCREVGLGRDEGIPAVIRKIAGSMDLKVVFLYRLACFLRGRRIRVIPGLIGRHLAHRYGCFLSLDAEVGIGLRLPHPNGIVIGEKTKIGRDCTIYHQVTLGGRDIGDARIGNYPEVGDNVTIFAGAKLIGRIRIGDFSKIGANSVVNRDVPPYSIAAGIPARVLKTIDSRMCEADRG